MILRKDPTIKKSINQTNVLYYKEINILINLT